MRRLGFTGLAAAAFIAAAPAMAATQSGTALAVVQQAQIDGESGLLVLQPQAPVHSGDRIVTGPTGEAQIVFLDDTRLVVGPSSSMVIDAFVYNPGGSAQQVSINAVKGAFRFITGNSNSNVYSITTPTSTIGVRGTEFDVSVEGRTGLTRVVNFSGVTRVCRRDSLGDCVEMRDPCTLSVARARAPVVQYSGEDPAFKTQQLTFHFPYVRNQQSLLDGFRVNVSHCVSSPTPAPGAVPIVPGPPPPPPPEPFIFNPPDPIGPNVTTPPAPDTPRPRGG